MSFSAMIALNPVRVDSAGVVTVITMLGNVAAPGYTRGKGLMTTCKALALSKIRSERARRRWPMRPRHP